MASIGSSGTVVELQREATLPIGTLLESNDYVDVFLDGFNGVRYLTGGPVVCVSGTRAMGRDIVVLRDASADPTLDRRGGAVFGEVGRIQERFTIVGNTRYCGQLTSCEELASK